MEKRQDSHGEREDVTLDERRRQESPGVDDGQLRHQRQVGDDDVGMLAPLAITDGSTQQGLEKKGSECGACDWWNIESWRHLERTLSIWSWRVRDL